MACKFHAKNNNKQLQTGDETGDVMGGVMSGVLDDVTTGGKVSSK